MDEWRIVTEEGTLTRGSVFCLDLGLCDDYLIVCKINKICDAGRSAECEVLDSSNTLHWINWGPDNRKIDVLTIITCTQHIFQPIEHEMIGLKQAIGLKSCTCPTFELVNFGCKCGGI